MLCSVAGTLKFRIGDFNLHQHVAAIDRRAFRDRADSQG